MNHRDVADLLGFAGSASALIGSVLLALPLFHLLRAREAIEDLERKLDASSFTEDQKETMRTALYDLRLDVRARRGSAFRLAIAGVAFLAATAILLALQGVLLYWW
jgi:hypothetical protein